MGLGSARIVGLGEARQKAQDARRLILAGEDPLLVKRRLRAAQRLRDAAAMTFNESAEAYIAAHSAGWKSDKHAAQWRATIDTYASPIVGSMPIQSVDTGLVMRVLEQPVPARRKGDTNLPLWHARPETASRLRGRIESIIDWAKVRGIYEAENPARWRGHLDKLLPAPTKVRAVEHHAALPYAELPAFMEDLRGREAIAARALEFVILTAARTSEALGARWDEIDERARMWVIPVSRMKAGREHRVPLSAAALNLLEALKPVRTGDLIFPGQKRGRPLSNMAMALLLRRMGRGDLTVHGFRSTFRDWAAECTNFPADVAEAALAHTPSSKVVAAYQRGDFFERRRKLMDGWARFATTPLLAKAGAIVSLSRRGAKE